jgi:mRNA interferase MazF
MSSELKKIKFKGRISNKKSNNDIKKGDIFFADLNQSLGSEQSGSRPVLVIQNNKGNKHSPTIITAPMTSHRKNNLPTHVIIKSNECQGLKKDSVVLLEQIRTIDKRRLKFKLGSIGPNLISQIDKALGVSLGL